MHPVSACLFPRFNRLPDFHWTKHGSEIAVALSKIDQILEIASRYENTPLGPSGLRQKAKNCEYQRLSL
jgi:hypothetical protein